MTKVTILGEEPKEKKLKPIEFKLECFEKVFSKEPLCTPDGWDNIELVALDFIENYDLMFAYDKSRCGGCLYLGHFNDGIV